MPAEISCGRGGVFNAAVGCQRGLVVFVSLCNGIFLFVSPKKKEMIWVCNNISLYKLS
jgi:hypothetical protein